MEKIFYKLEEFEGPLDLLLHLISKNKLNIYDIQVFGLVNQYLSYIESAEQFDMELASEFLEMAARLIHLKTLSLIPKHEAETETLKRELTGQLLEYQACKEIAGLLSKRTEGFDMFVRPQEKIEINKEYQNIHDQEELHTAYMQAAGRGLRKLPPPETDFKEIVKRKIVSVTSKIVFIIRKLRKTKALNWSSLFNNSQSKSDLIATFLAVLELAKTKRIYIDDDRKNCEIKVLEGNN